MQTKGVDYTETDMGNGFIEYTFFEDLKVGSAVKVYGVQSGVGADGGGFIDQP
jgi:hypothetical protein